MMRCFFLSDLPARFPDRKEIPLKSDLPTQSCHLFHSTLLNKTDLKPTENFFRTDCKTNLSLAQTQNRAYGCTNKGFVCTTKGSVYINRASVYRFIPQKPTFQKAENQFISPKAYKFSTSQAIVVTSQSALLFPCILKNKIIKPDYII